MTLERHKSKLIPDVDFNLEGRLFVTDGEGTFPVRGGGKSRDKLPGPDAFKRPSMDADDLQSYRSYDPKRERKFKPREPSRFGKEVANLPNATWGSGASKSLQRKLRKKKRQKEIDYYNTRDLQSNGDRYGTYEGARSNWSMPSKKKKKQKSYGGSVGKQRSYRSLDLQAMRKYQKDKRKADKRGSFQEIYGISNGKLPIMDGKYGPAVEQKKTIRDERLPGLLFMITGAMMFLLGVVKLLTCWWHQYFYAMWAGLLIMIQGILGAYHRGDYLTEWLNGLYITVGLAAGIGTLASTFLSLHLLIPIISNIAQDVELSTIAQEINRTNWHKSLAIEPAVDTMVYLNMGFDVSCLIFTLVSYFSITSTMVCVGNHWDAVYRFTGECDYRGLPRFFNPLEQISLGQATFLFGCITHELKQSSEETYYTPVWVGVVVMFAGLFGFFSLKRIDLSSVGLYSMFVELLAIVACSATTVMTILAVSDESSQLQDTQGAKRQLHMAAAVFDGFLLFFMLLNVIYCIGIMFRTVRKLFCYECWNGPEAAPEHTYA